ncbi:hypothetical protein C8R47DRAFT_1068187 [Mycena vitilis]|nr:hypothetical protein C8R47DRAFT_1068187 [Mycena vitilis]
MLLIARVMVRLEAWLTRLSWMRDLLTKSHVLFSKRNSRMMPSRAGRKFVPRLSLTGSSTIPLLAPEWFDVAKFGSYPEGNMAAVGIVSTLDLVGNSAIGETGKRTGGRFRSFKTHQFCRALLLLSLLYNYCAWHIFCQLERAPPLYPSFQLAPLAPITLSGLKSVDREKWELEKE